MKYVIGVDAGTTSFKAGIFSDSLRAVKIISENYELHYTKNGFIEFPPEEYWQMFCKLTRRLLSETGIPPIDIEGLSICSQGETMICTDSNFRPVQNAIVWTDARASKQANAIRRDFGEKSVFEHTGQREISSGWPATKLIWIKDNLPDVFKKISHVFLLEDYLIYRLTGHFVTDKSISSSTLYLDIKTGEWWEDMLAYIGLSEDKFPRIHESCEKIASITYSASCDTGLSTSTSVISGALDQASGMLGAGNIKFGTVTETTGTCLAVCSYIESDFPNHLNCNLPIHCGILPKSYYAIYWSPAAGSINKWISEAFYSNSKKEEEELFQLIDNEAAEIVPGSEGLTLMPYHSGINYPYSNGSARGVFTGISLTHKRAHFARASLESIAYLLRQSINEIAKHGIDTTMIYSLGGGSSSSLWNQIKADVTQIPIHTLYEDEVTCKGAAIIAAAGIGMFPDLASAAGSSIREKDVYLPNKLNFPAYISGYDTFVENINKFYDKSFQ